MSNLASQRPNPSIIEVFEEINNELQNDSEVQSEQMEKEDRETYMLALRTIQTKANSFLTQMSNNNEQTDVNNEQGFDRATFGNMNKYLITSNKSEEKVKSNDLV